MKHKNKKIGLLIVLCMLLMVACGEPRAGADVTDETSGENEVTNDTYEEEQGEEPSVDETTDDESESSDETNGEGDDEESIRVILYRTDDQGIGLVAWEEAIDYLSPENIVQLLIHHGELAPGIRVLSFTESGEPGRKQLALDLSSEFSDFIGGQGTSGEFTVLGSMVNTFLSAFGGESILITVEGGALTTPHMGELTEPLGRF